MTAPDPIVTVTAYSVTVLPEDHKLAPYATLAVRCYRSGWVVEHRGEFLHPGGDVRIAVYRWDSAEAALAAASEYAPQIPTPDGRTAADVLAEGSAR